MPRRYFTVEQANRALPLVRRIVADLGEALQELNRQRERLKATAFDDDALESDLLATERRIDRFLHELNGIGCELKDVDSGLLDFYARRGEEVIYLCWRAGEESIGWWHELHTGFPGRRPVSELPRETLGS